MTANAAIKAYAVAFSLSHETNLSDLSPFHLCAPPHKRGALHEICELRLNGCNRGRAALCVTSDEYMVFVLTFAKNEVGSSNFCVAWSNVERDGVGIVDVHREP
jgi:hypothetical protein